MILLIKVIIADDHALLAESLQFMLEQDKDIKVIGIAQNGNEVIAMCKEYQPDLVLMDIKMPGCSGLQATESLKKACPDIKIVILTTFESKKNILKGLVNKIDGYILKDIRPQELIMAVKCIEQGFMVMDGSIKGVLKDIAETGKAGSKCTEAGALKPEDIEIIKLISDGKNNREIAEVLNYSEGTIKNRVSRILKIYSVNSRTELVVFSLKNGII